MRWIPVTRTPNNDPRLGVEVVKVGVDPERDRTIYNALTSPPRDVHTPDVAPPGGYYWTHAELIARLSNGL